MIKDIRNHIEEKAAAHAATIKETNEQILQLEHELQKTATEEAHALMGGNRDVYNQLRENRAYAQKRLEYLRSISCAHTFSEDESRRVQEDLNTHAADELRPLYIKVQEHLDAGKQLHDQILAVLKAKEETSRLLYRESPAYAVNVSFAYVPPTVKKILIPDGAAQLVSLIER